MKKIFSYLAATAMLFAASCSNEDLGTNDANDTQVTFNLSLEGQSGTRAIGDGSGVNKLYFAVYGQNEDGTFTLYPEASVNAANTTNVERGTDGVAFTGTYSLRLKLAKDQTYKIVFWAQKDQPQGEEYYDLDFDNGKLTVDYDVDGNIEDRDAFYFAESYTIKGSEAINVVLKRPFAQLNVGVTTDDYNAAKASGVEITKSWAKVTGVYNTLNLFDGSVSGETTATFAMAATPKAASGETLTVGQDAFEYLSMNYVLVGAKKNVAAEFEFYSDNGKKIDFKSGLNVVPVERNFRTNLVGQILTGNLDFNVTIDPNFGENNKNNHNIEIWDGTSTKEPAEDPNNANTYVIESASELAWLAQVVNGTLPNTRAAAGDSFEGKTFKLESDINLNNQNWTPIGKGESFKGTFDGNGKTIYNLKYSSEGEDYFVGLFGCLNNATIKDLTITNVDIKLSGEGTWGHIGAVAGWAEGTTTLSDITINGSVKIEGEMKESGSHRIGGVIGGNQGGDVTFTNVNVDAEDGSYVKGQSQVGGIAGQLQVKAAFNNCSAKIDVFAQINFAGGIIGLAPTNTTFANCDAEGDITVVAGRKGNANDAYRVGGIAGGWDDNTQTPLVLTDCSYEGTLSGKDANGTAVTEFDYNGLVGRGYTLNNRQGSTVIIDGKKFVQATNDASNLVYVVIENGAYNVSTAKQLIAAVNVIEDGATIKLEEDITFTEDARSLNSGTWYDGLYYIGDKSFTIDLDGNTIGQDGAVNDYLLNFKNDGAKANTIIIKNGTIDAGTAAFCALATSSSNAQKMTINLENINLIGNNSNGAVLKIRGGAELNVNAGTKVTGQNSYVGIEAVGNGTVVNIKEGAEIYQNGTSSYVGAIVGASYNATLNISGGKGKSAKCGIIVMSTGATINVTGGEWTANGDGTIASDNRGVLVSQNNRYESGWACKSILNVTGGTFKGGYNCYGMGPGVEADDAQINIKGGNFNADPSAYVVEGYKAVKEGTTYEIVLDPAAKIGSTEYATLKEAFEVGGEITLLRNVTLSETATLTKTAVLDLNGKTITAKLCSAFEAKNGGKLTIKNGKVNAHEAVVRAIGGKVVVESGEYTSTGTALDSTATYRYSLDCREGGELIINGGTFKSNNGMINVSSEVVINGGKFENIVEKTMTRHFAYVSAKLTINDGEFYGKANGSAGGCFFCGAAAGCDIQVNGGKFTSLWISGSVNRIFEPYSGGTNITVTGGMFNTNGGITNFVVENTDEATKAAYPYVAK